MSESITELARTEVRAISVPMRPDPTQLHKLDEMMLQANGDDTVQVDVFGTDPQGNPYHESLAMDEQDYEQLRKNLLAREIAILPPFSSFKSGNTLGRVVGETPTAAVPASHANPPIEAETEAEGVTGGQILDGIQIGLDVVGLIPVFGEIADVANAGVSLARGDYVGAGLSLASAIPFIGWGAAAGKIGKRTVETGEKTAEKARKQQRASKEKNKVRRQTPDPRCGKVSTYRNAPKEKGLLNADHIPSGAALKVYAAKRLKEQGIWGTLDPDTRRLILNRIYQNAPTITIPEDVHKEGRTYGNKNKPLYEADGKSKESFRAAFERDTKSIQKSMDAKDHGCTKAYTTAVEELRSYDYDNLIDNVIKTSKHIN